MKTKVLIIGAGYYGISTACYLSEKKIPFMIIGKPFSLWFDHILDGTYLRSETVETEICVPGNKYHLVEFIKKTHPDHYSTILKNDLPIEIFRQYLKDISSNLPYTVHEKMVKRVSKTNRVFRSILDDGTTIESDVVVLATGVGPHASLPGSLKKLKSKQVMHSWEVSNYNLLKGKNIIVVGSGQSAAETISHLQKNNTLFWVTRHMPTFYKDPIHVPRFIFKLMIHLSPYLYFIKGFLRKIVPRNMYRPTITPRLEKALHTSSVRTIYADIDDLKLEKKNNRFISNKYHLKADIVISATGYVYSARNFPFLSKELQTELEANKRAVNFNFESSVPGLFLVGGITEPSHGVAQRFLFGARHAANRVSKALKRRFNS